MIAPASSRRYAARKNESRGRRGWGPSAVALVVALVLSGCCGPTPRAEHGTHLRAPVSRLAELGRARDAAIVSRAAELLAYARAAEPGMTALLLELARAAGGDMYKLEFRLKTEASLLRKMRSLLADAPPEEARHAQMDDVLRYTMRIEDEPPGHHADTVRAVLTALEARGHTVLRVKNYWPGGDNYSGVNGVLRAPGGLHWELQFHTAASIHAAAETRIAYEEMRRDETALARKRELYDAMTRVWQRVPIPHGILQPGALHPRAEILARGRP
jgi:hypothetical protein